MGRGWGDGNKRLGSEGKQFGKLFQIFTFTKFKTFSNTKQKVRNFAVVSAAEQYSAPVTALVASDPHGLSPHT